MLDRLSWALVRTAVVLVGAPFVAISLVGACLDYAGEELFQGCDAGAAPNTSGSGTGSGAETEADDQPDCGAPATPPPGSGSGSGS